MNGLISLSKMGRFRSSVAVECCIVDPEGCSMHRRSVCKFVEDEEFRRLTRAIKRWTDVDAESNDLGRHS